MTYKVYLAGRFSRLPELVTIAHELEATGLITVTSRWLRGGHEWVGTPDEDIPIERNAVFAQDDLDDIDAADLIVCFTEPSRSGPAPRFKTDSDIEQWANVPDSSCEYRVSSWGRITGASGDPVLGSPNRGYWYVKPNGKNSAKVTIHSLVAAAFIGPRPDGLEIDHVDGNKSDNSIDNLEYVTHQENVRRAAARGLYSRAGERNANAKLTADDAMDIRRRYENGERNKAALAREYGVGDKAIWNIVTGRSWNGGEPSKGGMHFEAGYAHAKRMPMLVVGDLENVFYCLPTMMVAPDWTEATWMVRGLALRHMESELKGRVA